MVKAIGIDSGTKTMDIYGFDDKDGKVLIDLAIPREDITKNPGIIIEKLRKTQQTEGFIDALLVLLDMECLFKEHAMQAMQIFLGNFCDRC